MQTLEDMIIHAGFESKKHFAEHIGRDPCTITRWGEEPPKLVIYYLTARIAHRKALEI